MNSNGFSVPKKTTLLIVEIRVEGVGRRMTTVSEEKIQNLSLSLALVDSYFKAFSCNVSTKYYSKRRGQLIIDQIEYTVATDRVLWSFPLSLYLGYSQ
jgi:hypothetical protein